MTSRTLSSAVRAALYTGSLTLLASALINPVQAQDSTPAAASSSTRPNPTNLETRTTDLDQVVVTARSGVDTRTKAETSYSLTTIDEDQLRRQDPVSVTDAVKSVPGFWVESSGGVASGNIRARGIPVDGYGSVNILEDGIPVQSDPALGYLNADQAFRLDETIQRIEVVRGGPSSIFYPNAPAGAINFIPRKVGDAPDGLIKYTTGNYNLNRLDFYYGTPLSNGWKLSGGGFWRIDDGVRKPGYNADKGGQLRVTLAKQFDGGDVSFDIKHLDDKVILYLGLPMRLGADGEIRSVAGVNGNYGTIAGPETENVNLTQGDGSAYHFNNALGTDVRRTQYTFKSDFDLPDDWKLAENVRYSNTDTQRNGVYPNTVESAATLLSQQQSGLSYFPGATRTGLQYVTSPNQPFDVATQNGNGLVIIGGLRGITAPVDEITNDMRLLRKFDFGDQSHDVTLGYYYAHFNQHFNRLSSSVILDAQDQARLLNVVALNPDGSQAGTITDNGIVRNGYEWANAQGTSSSHAFYLSDEWQVTAPLRIDGGVRWATVETKGTTEQSTTVNLGTPSTANILTGNGQFVGYDHNFHKLGWTLGANYQFNDRQGVFIRDTKTFRLPNLSSYITSPNATPIVQTMNLGEAGYKFSDRLMNFYATAFYTKYNNVSFSNYVFTPNSSVSTAQTGYASTKTYGLELEGTVYPSRYVDVRYDATLQQPKYQGLSYTSLVNNQPVSLNYSDNQLIRVPKISYLITPGVNLLDGALRFQLTYEYEGKRYVDSANSVVLPSYHKVDATVQYNATPNLTLYLIGDNLSNSLGLTEGNPRAGELNSQDAGASVFLARPLIGRSFRLSALYQFD